MTQYFRTRKSDLSEMQVKKVYEGFKPSTAFKSVLWASAPQLPRYQGPKVPWTVTLALPNGKTEQVHHYAGVDGWYINYNGYLVPPFDGKDYMTLDHLWPKVSSAWKEHLKRTNPACAPVVIRPQTKVRTISDNPTRGFAKIRNAGGVVVTAYKQDAKSILVTGASDADSTEVKFRNLRYTNLNNFGGSRYADFDIVTTPILVPQHPKLVDFIDQLTSEPLVANSQSAINSAYGNINVADLQALVMAGEARSTIEHLVSVVIRVAKILRALKTGNYRSVAPKTYRKWVKQKAAGKANSILDLAGDAWLEARYAILPLISDVQNGIALLKGDKPLHPRQTFRGMATDNSSEDISISYVLYGVEYKIEGTVLREATARAGVLCEATCENRISQVSAFNFADAAWELVPFSFVIDWFVNIGGLLYTLRPSGSYVVKGSWVVDYCITTATGTITAVSPIGDQQVYPFQVNRSTKTRTPGSTPTLFSIDLNLNLNRMIDAIAILRKLV